MSKALGWNRTESQIQAKGRAVRREGRPVSLRTSREQLLFSLERANHHTFTRRFIWGRGEVEGSERTHKAG